MPVLSLVDPPRRLVVSRAFGVLRDDDLYAHHDALRSDPDFEPTFRQLYDFRDVERVEVTSEAVDALANQSPFGAGSRRAFVVASDLAFGLARMYQAMVEPQGHVLRVFRDFAAACEWLGVDAAEIPLPGMGAESA